MASTLEQLLTSQLQAAGLPDPHLELRFHDSRRWRFDFAWPEAMVAVEIDGGTWSGGRHTRGKGFEGDCEKLNTAAVEGWCVLRFTGGMVRDGRALKAISAALSAFYEGDSR